MQRNDIVATKAYIKLQIKLKNTENFFYKILKKNIY